MSTTDASRRTAIAPSILDSDLTRLGETLKWLERGGADYVHLDVMDGHFVPNISIGVPVVASVRKATRLPLDVHLMIDKPERYIQQFVDAGADILTIHLEATVHPHRVLQMIRNADVKAGLALNPGTPVEAARDLLPLADMVLLMSVNPGFGGQAFIPETLERVDRLRSTLGDLAIDPLIEVDGGINSSNVQAVARAGATMVVAGSAVFRHPDGVEAAISELGALANGS